MSYRRRDNTLQGKLDRAFKESGLDHRKVARLILGPNARRSDIDSLRSQISKWRNKVGVGISDSNALKLARAFGLPDDHFMIGREKTPRPDRDAYHRDMQRLRRELNEERAAREQLEERVEELWQRVS